MSRYNMPPMADAPQSAPPQDFSKPLTANIMDRRVDNEDQWEYEYSTTETETFYVTLDLTTPDVPKKRRIVEERETPNPKRPRWTNPGLGKQKRYFMPKEKVFTIRSESQSPPPEAAPVQVQEEPEPPKEDLKVEDPPELQIMNIHTKNPVISYDGHLYSCEWSSNLGTEFLFTKHREEAPLPCIRTLPGNVDLLAASAARITAQHWKALPAPNATVLRRAGPRPLKRNVKLPPHQDIKVQIGPNSRGDRFAQQKFLQQIIAVKENKGEEDLVTVNASVRLLQHKWLAKRTDERAAERAGLENLLSRRGRKGEDEVQRAKARLLKMDAEDREIAETSGGKRKGGPGRKGIQDSHRRKKKEGDEHPEVVGGPVLMGTAEVFPSPVKKRKRGPKKKNLDGELSDSEELSKDEEDFFERDYDEDSDDDKNGNGYGYEEESGEEQGYFYAQEGVGDGEEEEEEEEEVEEGEEDDEDMEQSEEEEYEE